MSTPAERISCWHDGREFSREQSDYGGSSTQPMSWERVVDKFHWLAEPCCREALRADLIAAVDHLDEIPITEFAPCSAR